MTMELYGEHWDGIKGYRVMEGKDSYNHYFGGQIVKYHCVSYAVRKCIKFFVLI